jgi:hypothetical protein
MAPIADKGLHSGTVRHGMKLIPYKLHGIEDAKKQAYSLYLCAETMKEVKSLAESNGEKVSHFVEQILSAYIAKRE